MDATVIPDEAVEAAGLSALEWDYGVADWAMVDGRTKANYLNKARAALEAAAPHLLAARIVATTEELDALPHETVIRDGEGYVLEKWGEPHENMWATMMVGAFVPRCDIALPATVLHVPNA